MDKKTIQDFFDAWAPSWDAHIVRNEGVIRTILDQAGVGPGVKVLDVACGTGVLIPDYLARGASVTAIDLSPAMVAIAREKFPSTRIICGDIACQPFETRFDVAMVYNAWPHFLDSDRMIDRLAGLLEPNGVLSIAHGMSRKALALHHQGSAARVSMELPEAEVLALMLERRFTVTLICSDDQMYQVVGRKK